MTGAVPMAWFIRYGILALILACVVSLFSMAVPDPKASDRSFHLYVGSVVAACVVICILFQAVVPSDFKVVGEKDEVTETHSLATLKTDSRLSGKEAVSFGYINEEDVYVLMVRQEDGGYRRKCYQADSTAVYEDVDAGEARVDTVKRCSIIRCTYRFPIIGEWVRDRCLLDRREVRIHVPKGSIVQGEYDFR